MQNTNQRLRFLTAYREQLREELDQMNYGAMQAEMLVSQRPLRDRSPNSWIVALTILLVASIFLVAFTSTPESIQSSDSGLELMPSEISLSKNAPLPTLNSATNLIPDYTLFSFSGSEPGWYIVNDTVMGGRSQSGVQIDNDLGRLTFSGDVSLENNGGFASARSDWTPYNLEAYDGIKIRVRGDGNIYRFRIRTEKTGFGLAYTAWFKTEADTWQEIYIPFAEMTPLYRGIIVPVVGPIDPASIRSFGLMMTDKQQDEFSLEVDWITAVSENVALDIVSAGL